MESRKKICFVIQPISDNRFVKRFDDIYKPAIEAAGLIAYRVDLDPSAMIPIDKIEKMINDSSLCFVDITIDNPNVWYEFGYANAKQKPTIIICEENARSKFPFDVSHRSIIQYKTDSPSDFKNLKNLITEKCKAYLLQEEKSRKENSSFINYSDLSPLQPVELAILEEIIANQITDEQNISIYILSETLLNAGFKRVEISIGIRLLKQKNFIEILYDSDWNGNVCEACKLSIKGEEYILDNQKLFLPEKKVMC